MPIARESVVVACCLSLALAACQSEPDGVEIGANSAEWRFEPTQVIRDSSLGTVIGATLRTDGSPCVADLSNQAVVCFSEDGDRLWTSGRKGEGPGEFQLLYRLASGPSGGVYALDLSGPRLSMLDSSGSFQQRWNLPFAFRQVGDIVFLPPGRLAISGYAPSAGQAGTHGVHVFELGDSVAHLASFGPLPTAEDSRVLNYWGTGSVGASANGNLLFVLKTPYQIFEFTPDGKLLDSVSIPSRTRGGPEDMFKLAVGATSASYQTSRDTVVAPVAVLSLGAGRLMIERMNVNSSSAALRPVAIDAATFDDGLTSSWTSAATENGFKFGIVFGIDHADSKLWWVGDLGGANVLATSAIP